LFFVDWNDFISLYVGGFTICGHPVGLHLKQRQGEPPLYEDG